MSLEAFRLPLRAVIESLLLPVCQIHGRVNDLGIRFSLELGGIV
jgi:hypothetical protein